jgi:hypothetical protein
MPASSRTESRGANRCASFDLVRVRRAETRDLEAVSRIASAAWKTSLSGLLDPELIDRWLETAYSPAALQERLADHPIFVVIVDEHPVAFADAFIEENAAAQHGEKPDGQLRGVYHRLAQCP